MWMTNYILCSFLLLQVSKQCCSVQGRFWKITHWHHQRYFSYCRRCYWFFHSAISARQARFWQTILVQRDWNISGAMVEGKGRCWMCASWRHQGEVLCRPWKPKICCTTWSKRDHGAVMDCNFAEAQWNSTLNRGTAPDMCIIVVGCCANGEWGWMYGNFPGCFIFSWMLYLLLKSWYNWMYETISWSDYMGFIWIKLEDCWNELANSCPQLIHIYGSTVQYICILLSRAATCAVIISRAYTETNFKAK